VQVTTESIQFIVWYSGFKYFDLVVSKRIIPEMNSLSIRLQRNHNGVNQNFEIDVE